MGRTCMAQVSSLQATLGIGQNPGAGWLERARPCPVPLACLHARPGLALCPHTSSQALGRTVQSQGYCGVHRPQGSGRYTKLQVIQCHVL